jgi:hypothetical protein
VEVIRALAEAGYDDAAANLLEMQRQRVIGDYLQPAGIFAEGFDVLSALTDPNDYAGAGTGYRVKANAGSVAEYTAGVGPPRMANGKWQIGNGESRITNYESRITDYQLPITNLA